MSAKNIIITGGGGFLGRYTARILREKGHNITILGRRKYDFLEKEGFKTIQADICDLENIKKIFKGFDEVHHIASKTGISVYKEPFYRINVKGTKNVIEACLKNNIGKLIYTSSPSVVYSGKAQKKIDETAEYPKEHLDNYSKTKAIAENLVLKANKPGKLLTVALRPHLIWGPEDTNLIPRIISRAKSGRLFRVGNGKNIGDVTYVENAAIAHFLASEELSENSNICGKAYFITNDEPVNLWDFIAKILKGLELPEIKISIPYRSAYLAGTFFEKLYSFFNIKSEPIITRFLASQLATDHCYSIENAKKDIGYRPIINIEQGLEKLFEYYK